MEKRGGSYGALIAILTLLKGIPMSYNRDLQEDKEHLFPIRLAQLKDVSIILTAMVENLGFNRGRMDKLLQMAFLRQQISPNTW